MTHPSAQIGPAIRLQLHLAKLLLLRVVELTTGGPGESLKVKLHLLFQAAVDEAADLDVFFHSLHYLFFIATRRKRFDHQRVELGVLNFFNPVMLEQALKLRIEILIVSDAVNVVALHHPLDVQRGQRHCQRIMSKYCARDCFGWTNDRTPRSEVCFKIRAESFEKLDVLGFFTGKLQQGAHSVVVSMDLRSGMIQYEGQNELFDQTEDAQVGISSNLIQNSFLVLV